MPSTNPAYQKVVSRNNFQSGGFPEEFDRRSNSSGGSSAEERLLATAPDTNMMDTNDMMVQSHIPQTHSSEELMPHGGASSDSEGLESGVKMANPTVVVHSSSISRKEMFTVFVLCFVNLINYMDRLTIAGKWGRDTGIP